MKCSICLERCKNPHASHCGHIYCLSHIMKWLDRKSSCPLCKSSLTLVELFKIYDNNEEDDGKEARIKKSNINEVFDEAREHYDKLIVDATFNKQLYEDVKKENEKLKEKDRDSFEYMNKLSENLVNIKRDLEMKDNLLSFIKIYHNISIPPSQLEGNNNRWNWVQKIIKNEEKENKTPLQSVAFNPKDSNFLAVSSWDKICNIFDVEKNEIVFSLVGHESGVYRIKYSLDNGNIIATCSADKTIRLWNDSGCEISVLKEHHQKEVHDVSFIYSTNILISCSEDCNLISWDTEKSQCINIHGGHSDSVFGVTTQPLGGKNATTASASFDCSIRLWDLRSKLSVNVLNDAHDGHIIGIDYSPSGNELISGGNDGYIKLWDMRYLKCVAGQKINGVGVKRVSFSPLGNTCLAGLSDGSLIEWCMKSFNIVQSPKLHENSVFDVNWSRDASKIASCSHDGTFCLFDNINRV